MREQARRTKSTRAFLTKRVTQTRLIPRSVSIVYRFRVHSFYFQLLLLLLLLLLLSVFSLFVSTIYSSRRRVFCRHHVFLMLLLYPASSSSPVPLVRIRALRAVRTPAVCRKTKKERNASSRTRETVRFGEKRCVRFRVQRERTKIEEEKQEEEEQEEEEEQQQQPSSSSKSLENSEPRASRAPRCFSISAISLPPRVKNTDQVIFHTLSNAVETTTILLLLLLLFSIAQRRDQHSIKIPVVVLTCRNISLSTFKREKKIRYTHTCVLRSESFNTTREEEEDDDNKEDDEKRKKTTHWMEKNFAHGFLMRSGAAQRAPFRGEGRLVVGSIVLCADASSSSSGGGVFGGRGDGGGGGGGARE